METPLPTPRQERPGYGQLHSKVLLPPGQRLLARHRPWGCGAATGGHADGKGDAMSQGAAGAKPGLGENDGGEGVFKKNLS